MALETSWLDLCFVEKILRKSENDDSIKVMNIVSKPAASKGDNYTSDMIRITAEYLHNSKIKETKSIIIKLTPVDGVRQKIVSSFNVYIVFNKGREIALIYVIFLISKEKR